MKYVYMLIAAIITSFLFYVPVFLYIDYVIDTAAFLTSELLILSMWSVLWTWAMRSKSGQVSREASVLKLYGMRWEKAPVRRQANL